MKTVCIYHSIDLDGWMSAAIVKHWFIKDNKYAYIINGTQVLAGGNPNNTPQLDFIGYNYGQPIPDLSEYDRVIMCDISFPPDIMLSLYNTLEDNFTWLDHHISAINNNVHVNCYAQGERAIEYAACEITWMWFFPNEPMPEIVRLLGRYDCFGHKGTDEEQKVLEFQYGARAIISNYEDAYNYLIDSLNPTSGIVEDILYNGGIIYSYLCTDAKQVYKNGFNVNITLGKEKNSKYNLCDKCKLLYPECKASEIKFGDDIGNDNIIDCDSFIPKQLYKFIFINRERFNPINFGINYHTDGYDGVACFHYDGGRKVWAFSLYNDNGLVDCSIIAKQYSGGGHKGASGFIIDDINKIIENGSI